MMKIGLGYFYFSLKRVKFFDSGSTELSNQSLTRSDIRHSFLSMFLFTCIGLCLRSQVVAYLYFRVGRCFEARTIFQDYCGLKDSKSTDKFDFSIGYAKVLVRTSTVVPIGARGARAPRDKRQSVKSNPFGNDRLVGEI